MAGEWTTRKIGALGRVVTGKTPATSDPSFFGGSYPFITIPDLDGRRLIDRTARTLSEGGANAIQSCKLPQGSVMMSCIATIGKCGVTTRASFTNQQINSVIPGSDIDPGFLYYVFSQLSQELFAAGGGGSVYTNVSKSRFADIEVFLPTDISEQRAIAHILGTLDDKIELNRRMSETLECMARALFKSWFVDFEPVTAKAEGRWRRGESLPGLPAHLWDLFPDSFEDSELGEIPKGWEVTTIGDVAEVIDCLHSKKPERCKKGLPLLQLVNIRDDGLLDMTDTYLIEESDYKKWITRIEASPGDCVVTNVGRVGAVSQVPACQKAALGRNMTAVRCRCDFPFPTHLIEALLSQAMRDEMLLKIDTGTILDALNVRNIPRLRIVRSSHALLVVFERLCRPFMARMEILLSDSRTLAALRDALLPKLISGDLRANELGKVKEVIAK